MSTKKKKRFNLVDLPENDQADLKKLAMCLTEDLQPLICKLRDVNLDTFELRVNGVIINITDTKSTREIDSIFARAGING